MKKKKKKKIEEEKKNLEEKIQEIQWVVGWPASSHTQMITGAPSQETLLSPHQ